MELDTPQLQATIAQKMQAKKGVILTGFTVVTLLLSMLYFIPLLNQARTHGLEGHWVTDPSIPLSENNYYIDLQIGPDYLMAFNQYIPVKFEKISESEMHAQSPNQLFVFNRISPIAATLEVTRQHYGSEVSRQYVITLKPTK